MCLAQGHNMVPPVGSNPGFPFYVAQLTSTLPGCKSILGETTCLYLEVVHSVWHNLPRPGCKSILGGTTYFCLQVVHSVWHNLPRPGCKSILGGTTYFFLEVVYSV